MAKKSQLTITMTQKQREILEEGVDLINYFTKGFPEFNLASFLLFAGHKESIRLQKRKQMQEEVQKRRPKTEKTFEDFLKEMPGENYIEIPDESIE